MGDLPKDIISELTAAIQAAAEKQLRDLGFTPQDSAVWNQSMNSHVTGIVVAMQLANTTDVLANTFTGLIQKAKKVDIDALKTKITQLRITGGDGNNNYFDEAANDIRALLHRACARDALQCLEQITQQRGGAQSI